MELVFQSWKRFKAFRDRKATDKFLKEVAKGAEEAFRDGIDTAKSGRIYRRPGGGRYRASAPGEYPAKPTGRLRRSIKSTSNSTEAVVGSNTAYSRYLREGTSRMQRRLMSDSALQEAIPPARTLLKQWVRWSRT